MLISLNDFLFFIIILKLPDYFYLFSFVNLCKCNTSVFIQYLFLIVLLLGGDATCKQNERII